MQDTIQEIKQIKAFKVIVVGPQNAGKSSILSRLVENQFNAIYQTTLGIDFKTHDYEIEGKRYSLQLWDTAGQQKFRALTATYYKGAQGCICVFDMSDAISLKNSVYYIQKAIDEGILPQNIFLIGNKKDLPCVDQKQGPLLAEKYALKYFSVSAKKGQGIKDSFQKMVFQLVSKYGKQTHLQNIEVQPKINLSEKNVKKCCNS